MVEVIPHSDVAREDLPARQMLDIQMMVVVDGKERTPVRPQSHLTSQDPMCKVGYVAFTTLLSLATAGTAVRVLQCSLKNERDTHDVTVISCWAM